MGAPPTELQVLVEPRRWRLLGELAAGDRRVAELVAVLGEPQNLVSYHLGALRRAGLVSSRRSSFDGRDTYYRAELGRCRDALLAAGVGLHPGLRLAPSPADGTERYAGRVLFLCTGNSARSPMAEALLRARSGGQVDAHSAGSRPKPIHPLAVEVMAARGIDLADRPPVHVDRYVRRHVDRVITLCDTAREVCPSLPHASVTAHWSVADPSREGHTAAQRRAAFERVADELDERIGFLLPLLSAPRGGSRA